MLDNMYNQRILALAADIPNLGRLPNPQASATAHSRLCGSIVTVDLVMAGDKVAEFAADVKACALGQASSSIMARHVVGVSADELHAVRDAAYSILKDAKSAPLGAWEGRWDDLAVLEPVRDYKARHASTLLVFDAVVEALGKVAGRNHQWLTASNFLR